MKAKQCFKLNMQFPFVAESNQTKWKCKKTISIFIACFLICQMNNVSMVQQQVCVDIRTKKMIDREHVLVGRNQILAVAFWGRSEWAAHASQVKCCHAFGGAIYPYNISLIHTNTHIHPLSRFLFSFFHLLIPTSSDLHTAGLRGLINRHR